MTSWCSNATAMAASLARNRRVETTRSCLQRWDGGRVRERIIKIPEGHKCHGSARMRCGCGLSYRREVIDSAHNIVLPGGLSHADLE
jgi:hypothetical protein